LQCHRHHASYSAIAPLSIIDPAPHKVCWNDDMGHVGCWMMLRRSWPRVPSWLALPTARLMSCSHQCCSGATYYAICYYVCTATEQEPRHCCCIQIYVVCAVLLQHIVAGWSITGAQSAFHTFAINVRHHAIKHETRVVEDVMRRVI
jgi:hypothetical protein